MNVKNKQGFTLLEIVVVMIIVGVLAAIALPQLFSQVQRSRGQEAFVMISAMKNSIESCIMGNSNTYTPNCGTLAVATGTQTNPFTTTNFTYSVASDPGGYFITATRNTANGGDGLSTIMLTRTNANPPVITKTGSGIWAGGW